MDFDKIAFQFDNSPALRLLRNKHASLALSFFQYAFKANNRLQIPYAELKELLVVFLEHLDDASKNDHALLPQQFLDQWCDDENGFLRKYFEINQDEPITELTYDTERVIEWVHGLEKKAFVGTQSRFLSIFEDMRRIADQTEENPATRLEFLKNQRKKLDEEIKRIQTTGILDRMDSTQIRERFLNLLDDSRRLLSEFRLVEDIFKDLTRQIKEKKLKESLTKGDILRQVLDAHDHLEESDQGKSFSAFWNFLVSDENQRQLKELGDKILETPEISEFIKQNPSRQMGVSLRRLKGQLLQVGHKVLKSKYRFSEELKKLLHQRAMAENKRVLELTAEIKKLILENHEEFLERNQRDFITIQDGLNIQLPLSRPLWKPNVEARFLHKKLESSLLSKTSEEVLPQLQTQTVSETVLETQIESLLVGLKQVSLVEVIQRFPIRFGALEVLTYLTIAAKTPRHIINPATQEKVTCVGYDFSITVPQIIFTRAGRLLN